MQRPGFDSGECGAEFLKELIAKAISFAVVPEHRLDRIAFCLGTNPELRHLPAVAKTPLKLFDDLHPWPGLVWRPLMRCKPLVKKRLLPFVKRYLIHACRNSIPQRLNVIDLIINGKIVEAWWRHRQEVCHD